MKDEITIEKNVPLPQGATSPSNKYPWHSMDVGDSFFYPTNDMTKRQNAMHSSVNYYRAVNHFSRDEFSITTRRRIENGVEGIRVWRSR